MDADSTDTDLENATPETSYFKMMMEDNQIGRVTAGDNLDNDSIIGGQTIASLMNDGNHNESSKDLNTAENYSHSNDAAHSTMSIVGYDDVSTIANDTVDETTKAFFTGNSDRKDSKPRIRLFKEYKKKEYSTPEKKRRSGNQIEDDNRTQPETPPPMIHVPSSTRSASSHKRKEVSPIDDKDKFFFLRSKRIYIVAGVLALILFVSIVALAVALKGVRGTEDSEATNSSSENAILDLWPDLDVQDTRIDVDDKGSVDGESPANEVNDKEPIAATAEPSLPPKIAPPSPEPTDILNAQFSFEEALNLLIERDAVSSKDEMESNPDAPQYYATTWLSQDPNYYSYTEDRILQRWSLAVIARSLDSTMVVDKPLQLRRLQDGVGSDLLPGWMTYTDECTWFTSSTEVSTCDEDGMYLTIDLPDMLLGGTLPTELALLSNSLQHINLDGNELMGSIPKELEDLTNLVSLRLRRNKLEKSLSIDFSKLSSLEILDLGENKLTGFLPYNILYLTSPNKIYLDFNNLSGNIPWAIGNLNTLTTLALGDNDLSGWIPDSLAELENLEVLTLGNNELTGDLPADICLFEGLEVLSADCVEQACECCTECSTTTSPTPSPTYEPSPFPSPAGTAFPSKTPTNEPIVQVPTSPCADEISVLDFCFAPSASIGVYLRNCNSAKDDWVGVYRVDGEFDRNNLTNPELWSWTCGTRNCREAVTEKTIPLGDIHAGADEWPLEAGIYIALLARNSAQPYTAYAVSDTFVVSAQC